MAIDVSYGSELRAALRRDLTDDQVECLYAWCEAHQEDGGVPVEHWQEMVAVEPRLEQLLDEILAVRPSPGVCSNSLWYGEGGARRALHYLVGWHAAHPDLRTSEAWDDAYDVLYGLLPDCQHEGPFC